MVLTPYSHARTHARTRTRAHTHAHAHMCTRANTHAHVRTDTPAHPHPHRHAHPHLHRHAHPRAHPRASTRAHRPRSRVGQNSTNIEKSTDRLPPGTATWHGRLVRPAGMAAWYGPKPTANNITPTAANGGATQIRAEVLICAGTCRCGRGGPRSLCRCGWASPGPGADVAGVSTGPGADVAGWAQSRSRCGQGGPSPGADVARVDRKRSVLSVCGHGRRRRQDAAQNDALQCRVAHVASAAATPHVRKV
jgi:hypothetical protein